MIEHCRRLPRSRKQRTGHTGPVSVSALAAAALSAIMIGGLSGAQAQGRNFLVGQWMSRGVQQLYGHPQRFACEARLTINSTTNYLWTQLCRAPNYNPIRTMQRGHWRMIGRARVLFTAVEAIPDRSRVGGRRVPQRTIFNIVAIPDRNTMVIVNPNLPGRRYTFRRIGGAR